MLESELVTPPEMATFGMSACALPHTRGASRLAWQITLLALAAVSCLACNSVTTSELCSEDEPGDEDQDGLANCADPDCFGLEMCRIEPDVPDAAPASSVGTPWKVAGAGGASGSAGAAGAPGSGGSVAPPVGDAAITEDDDAGVVEPPEAEPPPDDVDPCSLCTDTETCVDGACIVPKPAPREGAFTLYVLSAAAPIFQVPTTQCFDNACERGLSVPFALCLCPPDPYVRVIIERGRDEIVVGETEVSEDAERGMYSASFPIDLEPGDVLRFVVYDEDDPFPDDFMYRCTPDLTMLEEGPLDCGTGLIEAELVARLE